MSTIWMALRNRWLTISARERRFLIGACSAIGIVFVWWLDDWQRQERAYLGRAIPAAEARFKSMRLMADEYQQYTGQTGVVRTSPVASEVLISSLKAVAPSVEATSIGTGQIAVRGVLAFDRWVVWLGTLPVRGWRLESADIALVGKLGTSAGLVQVDASLVAIATN